MSNITIETLNARINAIKAAERITKEELSAFSREVLTFILETEDVRPLNVLLGQDENGKYTLTPQNRATANLYFKEFVGFTVHEGDSDIVQFNKKKARVWDKYVEKVNAFLSNPENDIWSWAKDNVQVEKKPVVYAEKLQKLVEKALKDEENGISQVDVLRSVMAAGVSVDALLSLVQTIADENKAA